MNQKICKQLRRKARALTKHVRTEYNETQNQKPKQCGFTQQVMPSGTTVTVPKFVTTINRVVNPYCQRGVYLKLKQQVQHPL